MKRKRSRSNNSRDPVTVSHRMKVRNPVSLHRAEAAPAVALLVRLPVRR